MRPVARQAKQDGGLLWKSKAPIKTELLFKEGDRNENTGTGHCP